MNQSTMGLRRFGVVVIGMSLVMSACGSEEDAATDSGRSTVTTTPIEQGSETVTDNDDTAWLKMVGANAPQQMDPTREASPCSNGMLGLIYDRLIRIAPDGTLVPGLAASWEAPDETTFRLNLQEGVKFQDGTPFDAAAVAAHLERAKTSATSVIKGDLAAVESIEAVDETTVDLKLSAPRTGIMPIILSGRAGMVPSSTAVTSGGDAYGSTGAVGAGPYEYVANTPNNYMKLQAWDGYWQPDHQLLAGIENFGFNTQFQVERIRSGELNYVTVFDNQYPDVEAAAAEGVVDVKVSPAVQFGEFFVNYGKAPFDDIKVRQALNHAIDRELLAETVTGGAGTPAWGPLPEDSWAHSDDVEGMYEFDPAKAKELLAEAGHADGLKIRTAFVGNPYYQTAAEALQGMMAESGIELELVSVTPAEINNALYVRQEFDAGVTAFLGSEDPGLLLEAKYSSTGNNNPSKTKTDGLDELLAEGASSTDQDDRAAAYQEAEQLVMEQALAIPAWRNAGVAAFAPSVKNAVKGYTTCSLGDFITPPMYVAKG